MCPCLWYCECDGCDDALGRNQESCRRKVRFILRMVDKLIVVVLGAVVRGQVLETELVADLCTSLDLPTNGIQIRCQGVLVTLCGEFQDCMWSGMLRDGVEDVDDGRHRRQLGLGDKWTPESISPCKITYMHEFGAYGSSLSSHPKMGSLNY